MFIAMTYRIHHIPVCPFSQRVEILLALKGLTGKIEFNKIDISEGADRLVAQNEGSVAVSAATGEGIDHLQGDRRPDVQH